MSNNNAMSANPEGAAGKSMVAIVSSIRNKTAKLLLRRITEHPKYRKKITKFSKISAHCELDPASIKKGSSVLIVESRPLSKTKRWLVCKAL